jgi:hypothetical protein
VVSSAPADKADKVGLGSSLVITFSEPMAPLNLALALEPDPGDWWMNWNEAGTVVTATHAAFAGRTIYTATLNAKDMSGNPLPQLSWSFKTMSKNSYLPTLLRRK